MQDLTQQGIAALKAGDRTAARRLLAAAVDRDQKDTTAWLWLAATLNNDSDRATCLRQVLRLDPQNKAAQRGLDEILERQQRQATTAERQTTTAGRQEPNGTLQMPTTMTQEPRGVVQANAAASEKPTTPAGEAQESDGVKARIVGTEQTTDVPVIALPETMAPGSAVPPQGTEGRVPESAVWEETPAVQETAKPQSAVGPDAMVEDDAAEPAYQRRRARHEAEQAAAMPARVIFNARSSQVPALICFWLFLFGAGGVGVLLGQFPAMQEPVYLLPDNPAISLTMNVLVGLGLAILLELLVLYVIIRNLFTRYQLTDRQLSLRYHGRSIHLDLSHLRSAECHQNLLQKLTDAGNIEVEAVVNGQLALLRLRNVANALEKTTQIQSVISLADKKGVA